MKRGKSTVLILLFCLGIFLTGCEKLLDMGVDLYSDEIVADFIILPTEETGYQVFAEGTTSMNFDSLIVASGYTAKDVGAITLSSYKLDILNGDDSVKFNEFDMLETIINTSGVEEMVMAFQDTISLDSKSVVFKTVGDDLKDYIDAGDFTISLKGINSTPIKRTIILKAKMKFKLKVTVGDAIR